MAKAKKKKKSSKDKALLDLADSLRGMKVPVGNVTMGTDVAWADIKSRIHTGCTLIDGILGGHGLPRGRVTEILGSFAHGKSALAEYLMANNQKDGGISVLISSEGKFSKDRMAALGINLDELLIIEVEDLTQGFLSIFGLLDRIERGDLKGTPICIVWDTVSNAPTVAELASIMEKTAEGAKKSKFKDGLADRAREIRGKLRGLTNYIAQTNCALIFVSQTIARVGSLVRSSIPETPGGGGIKFLSSLRILVKQIGRIKDDNTNMVEGIDCQVEVVKSSVCAPFRKVVVPFYFDTGYDDDEACLAYLLDLPKDHANAICRQAGGWHYITKADGGEIKYRKKKRKDTLDEGDLRAYVQRNVMEAMRG